MRHKEEVQASMLKNVLTNEHAVSCVTAGENSPDFQYTVNATSTCSADFIIIGLDGYVGGAILNNLVEHFEQFTIRDFQDVEGQLSNGLKLRVVKANEEERTFITENYAFAAVNPIYVGDIHDKLDIYQVYFPDKNGKFPMEDGCEMETVLDYCFAKGVDYEG